MNQTNEISYKEAYLYTALVPNSMSSIFQVLGKATKFYLQNKAIKMVITSEQISLFVL